MTMTIKNEDEIRRMDEAGQVVALVHAGSSGDRAGGDHGRARRHRAGHARGGGRDLVVPRLSRLPGAICASVNDEIVHGIPGSAGLRDGDIISVDVGAILAGTMATRPGPTALARFQTRRRRFFAIPRQRSIWRSKRRRPGNRLGAIGHAVESHARRLGRGVVRNYGGHGIGRQMHEDPHVPNHRPPRSRSRAQSGLTLAIEPMLTLGSEDTRTWRTAGLSSRPMVRWRRISSTPSR